MRKCLFVFIFFVAATLHSFAASDVIIEGTHQIEGINSGTRTYVLTTKDGASESITEDVNKPFKFILTLKSPGIYEYTLHEEFVAAEGLIQDATIYRIRIEMNNSPIITIEGPKGKTDEIVFIDTYNPIKKSNSSSKKTSKIINTPKTGDNSKILPWTIMGTFAALAISQLLVHRKAADKTQKR